MFVDYYVILEIPEDATIETIKKSFRKQAVKWHPDRNHGKDTTRQMQLINEAYLILKDYDARKRFNIEYQKFKIYKEESIKETEEQRSEEDAKTNEPRHEYNNYNVNDDTLNRWMDNAKRQAVDLSKRTIKEFGGMVAVGVTEGAKVAAQTFLYQIGFGILFLILITLIKTCNS